MEDELIKYETAVLAKEKGFDLEVYDYFTRKASDREQVSLNYNIKHSHWTSRPTQSLLKRWLREKHNIHIKTELANFNGLYANHWGVNVYILSGEDLDNQHKEYIYSTAGYENYEDALEKGLQHALKLIK